MRLDTGPEPGTHIDLTPLIDVVFLLLVFFLTATTFSKEEVDLELELPEASSGVEVGETRVITINIGREGRMTVDGREVTLAALKQKLDAAAARDKDQEVRIRGDTQARFGLVANVLDACLSAELHSISIGATPGVLAGGGTAK